MRAVTPTRGRLATRTRTRTHRLRVLSLPVSLPIPSRQFPRAFLSLPAYPFPPGRHRICLREGIVALEPWKGRPGSTPSSTPVRNLETAVGAALGEAEVGVNQYEGSLTSEGQNVPRMDRHRFRLMYQYRMQFAEMCPTEEAMCNVLHNYGSWHDIADSPRLLNPKHASLLPPSWRTLYESPPDGREPSTGPDTRTPGSSRVLERLPEPRMEAMGEA